MLEVTIYNTDGSVAQKFDGDNEVDYVSLVNNETYGPPALIAPARNPNDTRAAVEEHVLYINTNIVPLFKIIRTTD